MTRNSTHHCADRRSPVLGVGGITLLMVVTMVLSGPALGRTGDVANFGPRGLDPTTQRVSSTESTAQRLGGRRQQSSNHTRPSGVWAALELTRPDRTLIAVCERVIVAPFAPPVVVKDRVGVRLLSLPPPRVL